eukprot:4112197-Pyramimonas_sp.AAC.1
MLPCLKGGDTAVEYYLAELPGTMQFPTARLVQLLGADRSRVVLDSAAHVFQSQGTMVFNEMQRRRADACAIGALQES